MHFKPIKNSNNKVTGTSIAIGGIASNTASTLTIGWPTTFTGNANVTFNGSLSLKTPLSAASGGTGVSSLSSLKTSLLDLISGDNTKGTLRLKSGSGVYGGPEEWTNFPFYAKNEDNTFSSRGSIMISNVNRMHFNVKLTSSEKAYRYMLPAPTENLTEDKWYNIHTTKDTIAIQHGGTGAITADAARANLGITDLTVAALGTDTVRNNSYIYIGNMLFCFGITYIQSIEKSTSSNLTITLPKSFSDTNYFVLATKYHNSEGTDLDKVDVFPIEKSTVNQFIVRMVNNSSAKREIRISWMAIGKKA